MGDDVMAVIAAEIVGGVFPIGLHHPFMNAAEQFGAADAAVEQKIKMRFLVADVIDQRRGRGIECSEDQPLVGVELSDLDQAPFR